MSEVADRAWRRLDAIVDWVGTLALLALTAVSFVAVIFRYVLNDSLTWSEEFARYLFIWMVFLGAAIAARRRAHIALDVFSGRLGARGERALQWVERTATLAFAALVAIPGWTFVTVGMTNLSPAMEMPMGFVYAAPVAGCALIVLYLLRPATEPARRDNEAI